MKYLNNARGSMDELEEIRKRKMEEIRTDLEKANWPAEAMIVSDAGFEDFVSRYPLVVVDCWAEWCGPCKRVGPIIDSLAGQMQGDVVFGKLDTDQNQLTARKFQITAIPTLLVFKNGQLADRMVGALPKANIQEKLKSFL
jgi:thioredoxin 1